MEIPQLIELHTAFWEGRGPNLILIPPTDATDDLEDYPARFESPRRMWESQMQWARPVVGWPTDGIPTVRPNLGVVFVPAMAGLGYRIQSGQMPWPGQPLSREQIRTARAVNVAETHIMRLAEEFYRIHQREDDGTIAAYHADTQGVFDIAHLLYGEEIFYELADPDEAAWIEELMDISLDLYVRASQHLKAILGEKPHEMIHGHGTSQGVYFPHAGVRMSEDTPTLLSPEMIERVVLPAIERAAEPFGGVFVHYCGRHEPFFAQLCRMECVRAIDLGNPEMYDTRWVLERCAESGTVLYSRIAAEEGEGWETYLRRVARLVKETGARCILRPLVFPEEKEQCAQMRQMWHELSA